MRVPDSKVDELLLRGFTVVEGFLAADELAAAQEALWLHFPRPEEYFADPGRFPEYGGNQFAGLRAGPTRSWDLNRLTIHPDLLDLAERVLGTTDLNLYKVELWAKYAGAADYDQWHHRDFANHSLVVPKLAEGVRQLTTFLLLSDVTDDDGPTKVVPLALGSEVPLWPNHLEMHALAEQEVPITGPAGTLFAYRTDVLHRGTVMTGARSARFTLLADYQPWGRRWDGKASWPHLGLSPHLRELLERATPRQRALFGFPDPGDPYWDEQTLRDVQLRYPGMDMTPYREAARPTVGP